VESEGPIGLSQKAFDAQAQLVGLSDEELTWQLNNLAVQLALRMHVTPQEVLERGSQASMGPGNHVWIGLRDVLLRALRDAGARVPQSSFGSQSQADDYGFDVAALARELHQMITGTAKHRAAGAEDGVILWQEDFIRAIIRQRVALQAGVLDSRAQAAFAVIEDLQAEISRTSRTKKIRQLQTDLAIAETRFNSEIERAIRENELDGVVDEIASLILTGDPDEALQAGRAERNEARKELHEESADANQPASSDHACPDCGRLTTDPVCPHCGTELFELSCSDCGGEVRNTDKFCRHCGSPFDDA
jgi:hypothetical protein